MKKPEIIMEDEHIIVCVKPDGMPAQSDKGMNMDLTSYLKTHLAEEAIKAGAPYNGEPYLAIIRRLDRPVGGIMVFAKTKEAAADLSRQSREHTMIKYYQAILNGSFDEWEGTFEDYIVKDGKTNLSRVCSPDTKGAKKAVLNYEVLDELETDEGIYTYVLIELQTGRHHQIRCQMASHNAPVYGDVKYNPLFAGQSNNKNAAGSSGKNNRKHKVSNPGQIALIATRLEFAHPVTKERLVFKTEPWGRAFDILDAEESL